MGNFTDQVDINFFYLKVDLLLSGIIYNVELLERLNVQPDQAIDQYGVDPLRYGGYFRIEQGLNKADPQTTLMYGYITDGIVIYSWELPNPIVTNRIGIYTILNNNTFVCAPLKGTQNWFLIFTELFKFEE